jgi:hypothetical protein
VGEETKLTWNVDHETFGDLWEGNQAFLVLPETVMLEIGDLVLVREYHQDDPDEPGRSLLAMLTSAQMIPQQHEDVVGFRVLRRFAPDGTEAYLNLPAAGDDPYFSAGGKLPAGEKERLAAVDPDRDGGPAARYVYVTRDGPEGLGCLLELARTRSREFLFAIETERTLEDLLVRNDPFSRGTPADEADLLRAENAKLAGDNLELDRARLAWEQRARSAERRLQEAEDDLAVLRSQEAQNPVLNEQVPFHRFLTAPASGVVREVVTEPVTEQVPCRLTLETPEGDLVHVELPHEGPFRQAPAVEAGDPVLAGVTVVATPRLFVKAEAWFSLARMKVAAEEQRDREKKIATECMKAIDPYEPAFNRELVPTRIAQVMERVDEAEKIAANKAVALEAYKEQLDAATRTIFDMEKGGHPEGFFGAVKRFFRGGKPLAPGTGVAVR